MRHLEVYGDLPGCECHEDDAEQECGQPSAVVLLHRAGPNEHPKSLHLYFFCRSHHRRIRSGEIQMRLEPSDG